VSLPAPHIWSFQWRLSALYSLAPRAAASLTHLLVRSCPEQKLKKRRVAVWQPKVLHTYCNKTTCTVATSRRVICHDASCVLFDKRFRNLLSHSEKVLFFLSCRPVIPSFQYILNGVVPKLLKHPKTSFTRTTYSTVICRPKTVGWPPVPRRLREIRRRDVTHSPYLLWKRRLGTVLELGEILLCGT